MKEFKRARSAEQKGQRMASIKQATAKLFASQPYHAITLTTIAQELGWSRANLYKYVTTKEEIFLELAADARDAYMLAVKEAFDAQSTQTKQDVQAALNIDALAAAWAHAAGEQRAWFVYGDILMSIVETNVTVERLKVFKKGYYELVGKLAESFGRLHPMSSADFAHMLVTIHNQGVGLMNSCANNPLVKQALDELGIERHEIDFEAEMQDFIRMCLKYRLES